jgi:hypothetical protein
VTALRQAITAEAQVLSALAGNVAAEQPRTKPRRNRTIRVAGDEDGVMAAEDITEESMPGDGDPAQVPPTNDEPAPATPAGNFEDIFGSIEGD